MTCPKYYHTRRTMLNSLTEAFPPLENLTEHETFLFTIRCHNWEVADALSKTLATVQCERGSLRSTLEHLSPINNAGVTLSRGDKVSMLTHTYPHKTPEED